MPMSEFVLVLLHAKYKFTDTSSKRALPQLFYSVINSGWKAGFQKILDN